MNYIFGHGQFADAGLKEAPPLSLNGREGEAVRSIPFKGYDRAHHRDSHGAGHPHPWRHDFVDIVALFCLSLFKLFCLYSLFVLYSLFFFIYCSFFIVFLYCSLFIVCLYSILITMSRH